MTQAGLGDKREREEAPAEDGAKRAKPAGKASISFKVGSARHHRVHGTDQARRRDALAPRKDPRTQVGTPGSLIRAVLLPCRCSGRGNGLF